MKKGCLSAAALLLASVSPVFAGDISEPLIVTATRTAQSADETLAPVTVITRDDIKRLQASSVQDVLRGVPGINISNNGGSGKATSIILRGTNSDHVLVLIDGIKVGSATLGTTSFQDIPVDQIDRIEIVRGPRSSLYGSEAIGGVIQIFTRKGGGAFTPSFSLGAGSDQTYKASAGVSGGGDLSWYNLNISSFDTGGIDSCRGNLMAGCYTVEPDKDGYRNSSGSLRAGYRFADNAEVEAHILRTQGHNKYDGSFVNESDIVQQAAGASLSYSPSDRWHATLLAGRSNDDSNDFLDGVFSGRFKTERDTLSLQNDLSVADKHLITLGLDYQNDKVDSTTAYDVTARNDKGLFAQYQGSFGQQDVQFAMRGDDNGQFGHHGTGSAAWGYNFGNGMRLTASYGTAFKAPTFNQLYYPGFGNPNLKPETSRSAEVGLHGKPGWGSWSLNAYQTMVDQLIGSDANFNPANIDSARIRGIEAISSTHLAGWDISGNLTLLNPENRSGGANQGNVLPRRAKQTLSIDLDRIYGQWRFGTTLFAAGRRYDDLANTVELGGYATVDLRAEYAFTKDWLLQGRVGNVLDKRYETAAYFNQPRRDVLFTLRYQPGVLRRN